MKSSAKTNLVTSAASILALMVSLFLLCCAGSGSGPGSSAPGATKASDPIPTTLKAALDSLDKSVSETEKQEFASGQITMDTANRGIGKHFRNAWQLWHESPLVDYFRARGISDAEIMSDAILEAWQQRLKTGSYDEKAILSRHAQLESKARRR